MKTTLTIIAWIAIGGTLCFVVWMMVWTIALVLKDKED